MSIDTAEKRASVAWLLPTGPPTVTPNSAQDQEWRQEAGWGYSGILVAAFTASLGYMPDQIVQYRPDASVVEYRLDAGVVCYRQDAPRAEN